VSGPSIFMSYRRDDTSGYGGRLYERLARHYGPDRVFRDVDAIRPGTDFVDAIHEALAGCGAVLVLMGQEWLSPRLHHPDDFVRLEVAAALARGVAVIPVFVEEVTMPAAADLPEPLAPLTRLQGIELSEERWDYDVGRLIARLHDVVREQRPAAPHQGPDHGTSVWYLGFKLTPGVPTLETGPAGGTVVAVPVTLENQGVRPADLGFDVVLSSGDHHWTLGSGTDVPQVPGRRTGTGTLRFAVDDAFSLADAVLAFGAAGDNQAAFPLGSHGRLVTLAPVPARTAAPALAVGGVRLELRGAELRFEIPGTPTYLATPLRQGSCALVVRFDASTTQPYGFLLKGTNLVLAAPDGTDLPSEGLSAAVYPAGPQRDLIAVFVISGAPAATYRLKLIADDQPDRPEASVDVLLG
jgi:hypothetical protein